MVAVTRILRTVDLDDVQTRPAEVQDCRSSERVAGTTEHPGDLSVTPAHEDEVIALLTGRRRLALRRSPVLRRARAGERSVTSPTRSTPMRSSWALVASLAFSLRSSGECRRPSSYTLTVQRSSSRRTVAETVAKRLGR
jgi:hypothetical protein